MQRSIVNPLYTGLAWLPFLAVAAFCILVLAIGAMRLEALKGATNYFGVRGPESQYANQYPTKSQVDDGSVSMLGVG